MAFGSESEDSETRVSVLNFTRDISSEVQPICQNGKKYVCNGEGCGASFSRPWRLSAHSYIHTGQKNFTCDYNGCQKSYTSTAHLKRHKNTAHSSDESSNKESFKCKYPGCEVELKSKFLERRHFKRVHVEQLYTCSECNESFKKRTRLREHIYTHSKIPLLSCDKCNKEFSKPSDLKRHLIRGHKTHTCELEGCNETFTTWSLFRKHCSSTHRPEFICDHCSKSFKRKPDVRNHILRHLKRQKTGKEVSLKQSAKEIASKSKETIVKKYICEVEGCRARFSRPWRLTAHNSYVHLGKKGFPCEYEGCNKTYTTEFHLRRHKNTAHSTLEADNEIFKCKHPGCVIELRSKFSLERHFKRTHVKKQYACTECDESFRKHSQLKAHTYTHTGIPPLSCGTCGKGFVQPVDFNRHMRGHRIHTCRERGCIETFPTWSLLRKHCASVHKPEFICDYCSKNFKRKIDLRYHVVRHLEVETGRRMKGRKKNYLKTYTCNICQKEIKGNASLKRHINTMHKRTAEEDEVRRKRAEERKNKGRAKRKDAGIPKQSLAGVLAEVSPLLPWDVEKRLISKEKLISAPEEDEREVSEIILNHTDW